jgi:hypothetical protein
VLWTMFLRRHGGQIRRVQYDVWCGEPIPWPEGVEPVPGQSEGCGCKRVDAIYEDLKGHLHLVEIKPYGNYVALGQIQLYEDLMCQAGGPAHQAHLEVVCFQADDDLRPLAKKLGIRIFELGLPPVL